MGTVLFLVELTSNINHGLEKDDRECYFFSVSSSLFMGLFQKL